MGDEPILHRLGGGDDHEVHLMTNGVVQVALHATEPVLRFQKVTNEPAATSPPRPQLYFRLDERSKWQLCVLFPSGVSQVALSEP